MISSSDPSGEDLHGAALLADTLGLDLERATDLLLLTHWVDHEVAIARHGYPRDNVLPPPLSRRLADRDYVARLRDALLDEDAPDAVTLRALEGWLAALQTS